MAEYYIAIDIGGTRMRASVFPAKGDKPVRVERISTKGPGTPLERLASLVSSVWPTDGPVLAMAAAAPGPIDPRRGILFRAPNIPGWLNLPLRKELEDRFHVPVAVGNDANLAALGEWRFGAGVGFHNLIYITISTGIGGGVILDDRLVLGERGLAAEIGHITVVPDGPLCGCGQRGHLEAIASGTAIARYVSDRLAEGYPSTLQGNATPSTKEIAAAARAGDELSIQALQRAGTFLGVAMADFLHIYNPNLIILGGGVSRSGSFLMDPLQKALEEHVMSAEYLTGLQFKQALLGDEVGLFGALALAQMHPQL